MGGSKGHWNIDLEFCHQGSAEKDRLRMWWLWCTAARILLEMTDEEFQKRLLSLPGPPYLEEFEEAWDALYEAGTPEQSKALLEWICRIPRSERLTPEQRICRRLRVVFGRTAEGAEFLDAPELHGVHGGILGALENFLPPVLAKAYPYWKHESLDGFHLFEARKVGPREAVIAGLCILISDETVTPFEARLMVAESGEEIARMECRLGKRGAGAGEMERLGWRPNWEKNPFGDVANWREGMDWVYKVGLGER